MSKIKEYGRYIVCVAILMAIFAVYGVRLINWQIIDGASYLQKSMTTNVSTVKMPASRGEILDVNGNALAVNKTVYSIVFDKVYMEKDTENKTILQLSALLTKRGEKWVDELPIIVNAKGKYTFVQGKEKEIATLKSKNMLNLNPYATAEECMKHMIENYECSGLSTADTRTVVSVRYNMEKSAFSISNPYTFAENVSQDTVSIVKENSQSLPGATIQVSTERQYSNGTVAPHIIGTLGSISQEEYDQLKDKGYAFNDRLGKSGIEQALEDSLRGENGQKVIETTRTGSLASSTVTKTPVPGHTVYLTLDSRIQAVANASLAKNVKLAQENGRKLAAQKGGSGYGEDCVAGGAVVLNVKDFSVLAAATYPSYDLTEYMNNSAYYLSLINDKNTPLVNRAFNGAFMPGSCFKPVVACAALQEGVLNASTRITCNHVYERFAPSYTPKCMGNHGSITVTTALAKSCNIFFFETGWRLGISKLDLYAKRFGFGTKTGIEVSESAGKLSSPEERKAAGGTWEGSAVIQAAIGQADTAATPLQLAAYTATIANNGVRLKTHLVSKITDYSRKDIISVNDINNPTIMDNINVSQQNIDLVKTGMREVVTSGTATSFKNYGIAIAGKTGTAQTPPHSDNTVFIAFAPYDKPEIAVAVILEYGAKGTYSTAVARDIFDAYFFGKSVDASGNMVMPTAADSVSSGASSSSSSSATSSSTSSSANR